VEMKTSRSLLFCTKLKFSNSEKPQGNQQKNCSSLVFMGIRFGSKKGDYFFSPKKDENLILFNSKVENGGAVVEALHVPARDKIISTLEHIHCPYDEC